MSGIGVTMIGASSRSTMMFGHFKNRPDDGLITGVYDIIPQRAEAILKHYGLTDAKVYKSLDEAVHDKRAQAAFVSTTDCAHAESTIAALDAGLHVFCEKPMATTLKDCDAMIAAGRKAKGVFYVGMNLRHGPVHEKMHEILTAGRLGKLLTIEANEYYSEGRTYFRRWNRLRQFGGGLWLTKSCHDFDLLNWFAGGRARRVAAFSSLSHYKTKAEAGTHCRQCSIYAQCPDRYDVLTAAQKGFGAQMAMIREQVTGQWADICLYNSDKDTFDNGQAMVEYDNDVRASYCVNVVSARDTRQLRLMGTDGAAEGDMHAGVITVWKRHDRQKQHLETVDLTERIKTSHGGADVGIMADFFRCCRTGDRPRSSWSEGRACVELALAATEACDTGKVVDLPGIGS